MDKPSEKPELKEMELSEIQSPQAAITARLPESLGQKYEDLGKIGEGGMATIHKARHRLTGQLVAIKLMSDVDQKKLQRFGLEARSISKLSHSHIVHLHDFDIADDQAFIVMEYVAGQSLAEIIQQEGTISEKRFLNLFLQVCAGLEHAHQANIVHRDIKPSNILVEQSHNQEVAKIADFGIAKALASEPGQELTQTGEIIGTPLYMSPEQSMGSPAGKSSDIYSLGCVMYECLAGVPPIVGSNLLETVHKRLNESPKRFAEMGVKVSPTVESIIFRCLAIAEDDRYASASALKADLQAAHDGRPITSKGDKRGLWILAGVILSAGACLAIYLTLGQAPRQSAPAPSKPPPHPVARHAPAVTHAARHGKLPAGASKLSLTVSYNSSKHNRSFAVDPVNLPYLGLSDGEFEKLTANPEVESVVNSWKAYYDSFYKELQVSNMQIPKDANIDLQVLITKDGNVYPHIKSASSSTDPAVQKFYDELLQRLRALSGAPGMIPPENVEAINLDISVSGLEGAFQLSADHLLIGDTRHNIDAGIKRLALNVELTQLPAEKRFDAQLSGTDGLPENDYQALIKDPQVQVLVHSWRTYYEQIFEELKPAQPPPTGARIRIRALVNSKGEVTAKTDWSEHSADKRVQNFYDETLNKVRALPTKLRMVPPGNLSTSFEVYIGAPDEGMLLTSNEQKLTNAKQ